MTNHQNRTRQESLLKVMPLSLFLTKFEAKSTPVMVPILQITGIEWTLNRAGSWLHTAIWEETTHNLICLRSPSCWRMLSKLRTPQETATPVRTPGSHRLLIKAASLIQASTQTWITASVSITWSKTQEMLCLRYMSFKRRWSIKTKYQKNREATSPNPWRTQWNPERKHIKHSIIISTPNWNHEAKSKIFCFTLHFPHKN